MSNEHSFLVAGNSKTAILFPVFFFLKNLAIFTVWRIALWCSPANRLGKNELNLEKRTSLSKQKRNKD